MKKALLSLFSMTLFVSCQQLGAPVANDMTLAVEQTPVSEATPVPAESPAAAMDIVDTAVAAGNFTTLARALTAANLVETLKGEGPFTVFAPTDEAFAALPEGTLDSLLANPEELAKVLTYHVVSGDVSSETVVTLDSATTVQGSTVDIMVNDGKVMVNNATVTQADIKTSNGTIHVIDTVLLPPASN